MALDLDRQAQVEVPREVDGQLDLSHIGHIDYVRGVAALGTGGIAAGHRRRHTAHTLEERPVGASSLGGSGGHVMLGRFSCLCTTTRTHTEGEKEGGL